VHVVQSGLYRQSDSLPLRLALEKALVSMLLNQLWDSIGEPLLDVLWGAGSTNWDAFVSDALPWLCSTCSGAVQVRAEGLLQPFVETSGSLNDFTHFASCMGAFVNDVRFYSTL
jgi:hypothetical protein